MVTTSNFGFHSIFFYYGKSHLMVNLYQYIKTGIEKNEFMYLNIENKLFKSIINYFSDEEKRQIEIFSLGDRINKTKKNGRQVVDELFIEFQENVIENGYSGVRVIWDAGTLINELSRGTFINIEKTIQALISELKVSLLCVYDFDNYVNLRTTINKKLIKETYKTYDHKYFQMKLIEI